MRYRDGEIELDGNTLVLQRTDGQVRVAVQGVTGVEALPAPGGSATLRIHTGPGDGLWECEGCAPVHEVQALLRAISAANPSIRADWSPAPSVAASHPLPGSPLIKAIDRYSNQGYRLIEERPDHAVLYQPKRLQISTLVALTVVGVFVAELPVIVYLLYYFLAQKGKIVELHMEANGRVHETHYKEGEPRPLGYA